jgi:hypothetical protein
LRVACYAIAFQPHPKPDKAGRTSIWILSVGNTLTAQEGSVAKHATAFRACYIKVRITPDRWDERKILKGREEREHDLSSTSRGPASDNLWAVPHLLPQNPGEAFSIAVLGRASVAISVGAA